VGGCPVQERRALSSGPGPTTRLATHFHNLCSRHIRLPPGNAPSINPVKSFFDANGGSGAATITSTIPWSINPVPFWLTIISAQSGGPGSSPLNVNVSSNSTSAPRTASIGVGTTPYPVTQRRTTAVFGDVTPDQPFFDTAGLMRTNGITAGCSINPLSYCPGSNITRGQAAVFVIRGWSLAMENSPVDNFQWSQIPWYSDVPATHLWFKWIQKMADLQITSGCQAPVGQPGQPGFVPRIFCINDTLQNFQLAIFTVRARQLIDGQAINNHLSCPGDFSCAQQFNDVDVSDRFYQWVQRAAALGIVSRDRPSPQCPVGSFCEALTIQRGQASFYIVRGELKDTNN
jgi:hypothetical protein